MRNKKLLIGIVLLVVLVSVSASAVLAAVDIAQAGRSAFGMIGSFISGGYQKYTKLIDFFCFFAIYTCIAMLGLNKFMSGKYGESGGPAAKVLGVVLGFTLAMVMVLKGVSIEFFFPFAKFLLYFIVVLIVYLLLSHEKILGNKSKFWPILIAIIVTYLLFAGLSGNANWAGSGGGGKGSGGKGGGGGGGGGTWDLGTWWHNLWGGGTAAAGNTTMGKEATQNEAILLNYYYDCVQQRDLMKEMLRDPATTRGEMQKAAKLLKAKCNAYKIYKGKLPKK